MSKMAYIWPLIDDASAPPKHFRPAGNGSNQLRNTSLVKHIITIHILLKKCTKPQMAVT